MKGFVAVLLAVCAASTSADAQSLRFFGHGGSPGENFVFPDRVKVDRAPPSSVNVGAGDFTVEFFMRALASENPNGGFACGFGNIWVNSNIIIDNDRFGQSRGWGIGLLDGAIAFGLDDDFTSFTLCSTANVVDDQWHHVAVDRESGTGNMRIWIDGVLDAEGPVGGGGPGESVEYLPSFVPGDFCSPDGGSGSQSCINSDPFLVFGAEKHGFGAINYSGYLDEVKLSNSLRYSTGFTPPSVPFVPLPDTAALYHFDEPSGAVAIDATGQGADGVLFFGGSLPAGPVRSAESPFSPIGVPVPGLPTGLHLLFASLLARVLVTRRAR